MTTYIMNHINNGAILGIQTSIKKAAIGIVNGATDYVDYNSAIQIMNSAADNGLIVDSFGSPRDYFEIHR